MKKYHVMLTSKDFQNFEAVIEAENAFKAGDLALQKIKDKFWDMYEYKIKYVLDKEQNLYYYW